MKMWTRIEAAARVAAATPPGGWPETRQACSRLLDEAVFFRGGQPHYRLPSGSTRESAVALAAWIDDAPARHPDRRERSEPAGAGS